MTINTDGSGSFMIVIDLDPALVQYIIDIGEAGGKFESAEQAVIFDQTQIRKELISKPGVVIKKLKVPQIGRLELEISFKNIEQVFRSDKVLAEAGVVKFIQSKDKTLKFHLDKRNFSQILSLFPLLKSEEFKTLLPRESESKEDYFEVIDFALDKGSELVKNTTIKMAVTVNGKIIKQSGGWEQNNVVHFNIPLERLLFLDPPFDLSVQFQ